MGEKTSNWGQERRLEFIDFRLYWHGKVNRSDLTDFFGVSVPQASLDLRRYQESAPQNILYDTTEKAYLATEGFHPVFANPSSHGFLDQLLAIDNQVVSPDSSFIGFNPPLAALPDPGRTVAARTLRLVVKAIQNSDRLKIVYQSMDHPDPKEREVSPHALGFSGNRWHMRAYCYSHQDFRDFVLARIISIEPGDHSEISAASDTAWNRNLEAVIVPHPKLSKGKRNAVLLDYGMKEGKLVLTVREAMMFYLLDRLNLLRKSDDPLRARYLFLANRKELQPFFRKHGISDDEPAE